MPDQSSAASEHALLQEITAPLETLPDDPLALVEAEFPTAMRGYDRHAVDDYVQQITRLVAELHATRSPEAAVRRALERVGDQISGVLQRAHETAEKITAQSRMEAEDRLERARREGLTMIEAAERRVRELDADADRVWAERARIVADVEALSGQLLAVARDAAVRFPEEETRPARPIVVDHIADHDVGGDEAQGAADQIPPEEAELDAGAEAEGGPAAPEQPAALGEDPVVGEDPALGESPALGEDPALGESPGLGESPAYAQDAAPGQDAPGQDVSPAQDAAPDALEADEPTVPIEPTERITLSQDDSTRIIPPSSDAARRRES